MTEMPPSGPDEAIEDPAASVSDPVAVFDEGDMDLRSGSDDCYKCSVCDTDCPVAEVDDEFPGPRFQGPEQWRLRRKADTDIDASVMTCSNCMRCDSVCPSGVPLSQMHNTARAAFVSEQMTALSRKYLRNRLLANYGTLARVASRFPRMATALLNSRPVRWLNERLLGITGERAFPAFATETFRRWWRRQGGDAASRERAVQARRAGGDDDAADKRVAYFHGDYANYNTTEVARSVVRVYEQFGYEVVVPEQRCSGTPMFANGMLEDARRAAAFNVRTLHELVEAGYDVICSCTSCSMALRQEYPEMFDFEGTAAVAAATYEAIEYLRINEDLEAALDDVEVDVGELVYHAPCHARNQGIAGQPVELFRALDGVHVTDVGDSCSGISGTYGWKAENYGVAMAIGEDMFDHMTASPGDSGLTECPTCAMQMEHGTGYDVRHPMEVLAAALVE